jgi:hypothetical protein
LTDKEDVDLPTRKGTNEPIRTFEMTGPESGTTVQLGDNEIITCDWYPGREEDKKQKIKRWPGTEEDWQYVLKFPAPDYIYGLVPEYVWIYGYPDPGKAPDPSKPEKSYYARALRFRYNKSADPQFRYNDSDGTQSELCEAKNNQIDICADHLGGADPGYSIEIRYSHYHSVPSKKAEYFADAQSCFESMREKLSPCDTWKAFFGEDPAKSGRNEPYSEFQASGPSGPHDCGAPVMALQDGVSLK